MYVYIYIVIYLLLPGNMQAFLQENEMFEGLVRSYTHDRETNMHHRLEE